MGGCHHAPIVLSGEFQSVAISSIEEDRHLAMKLRAPIWWRVRIQRGRIVSRPILHWPRANPTTAGRFEQIWLAATILLLCVCEIDARPQTFPSYQTGTQRPETSPDITSPDAVVGRPSSRRKQTFPFQSVDQKDLDRLYSEIRQRYNSDAVMPWEESRHLGPIDPRARIHRPPSQQRATPKSQILASTQSSDSVILAWDNHFAISDSASDVSVATAVVTDRQGNAYVTGYSDSLMEFVDIVTLKYDTKGHLLWQRRYSGPDHSEDYPSAIAIDSAGDIIVAGSSYGLKTGFDYIIIKYSRDGTQQWVSRYNGPDSSDDLATCVGADPSGNVYVGGGSFSYASFYDYATVKYSPDGNQLWAATYNGPLSFDDGINALTVGRSGEVVVTGMSNSITGGADIATIKYSTDGIQQWISGYDGVHHLVDRANAITRDESGNIYATGIGRQR